MKNKESGKLYWLEYYGAIAEEVSQEYKKGLDNYLTTLSEGEKKGFDYNKVNVEYGTDQLIDLESDYCLMEFMEVGLGNYLYVLDYIKAHNFTTICDIGVALGWQSDMFILNSISYIGVDTYLDSRYRNYKNGKVTYIEGFYPNISKGKGLTTLGSYNKDKTLGVAILSLGWRIYVGDDKDLIYNQFTQLSKDFKTSLVYISSNILTIIQPLFKTVTKLDKSFYLLESY